MPPRVKLKIKPTPGNKLTHLEFCAWMDYVSILCPRFRPKNIFLQKNGSPMQKCPRSNIYSVKLYKTVSRCTSCNSPAWHVSTISEAAAENVSAVSTLVQERGPDYGLVRRSDVHFYVEHNHKTESYHKNKSQYKFCSYIHIMISTDRYLSNIGRRQTWSRSRISMWMNRFAEFI